MICFALAAAPGLVAYLAACAVLGVEEVQYGRGYLVKLARSKFK